MQPHRGAFRILARIALTGAARSADQRHHDYRSRVGEYSMRHATKCPHHMHMLRVVCPLRVL
eukprot:2683031-Prymnesium_polylepis.1